VKNLNIYKLFTSKLYHRWIWWVKHFAQNLW